ncbi:MAG: tRNA epoxyqueuosine(34) reductase QueG [Acidobacteriota bacterium]
MALPDSIQSPLPSARRVKDQAISLGASRAGICRAEPIARAGALDAWLEAGHHGSMAYMARAPERRADPRAVYPEARSIVVIAVDHERSAPSRPRVARYAVGRDYHDVLGRILEGLARFLASEYGARSKSWVDTGPILERELAMAAGLGFIGKNTNAIHKQAGSYFLIGELLTDLDLPPDAPSLPHCGTCTRCLDYCPTGAFVAPYVLDARRCISYLTIEHRGALPRRMRARLGSWAFGCDVCQEVCPWNRKDALSHPELSANGDPIPPSLLDLDEPGAKAALAGRATSRPKRRGLLRNLALLDSTPATWLRGALRDPDPLVRRHAAFAIGRRSLSRRRALR